MKKLKFILVFAIVIIIGSCGSSSKTTATVDPHSAAHSKVHQDYIDKKEKEISDEKLSNELQNTPTNADNYNAKIEGMWVVTEVNSIVIDPHSFKYKRPSLDFKTKKEMAIGNDGCNSFNVSFKITDNEISFGQLLSTLMACKDNVEITNSVRKALSGKELSFKIENSKVYLTDGNELVMTLLQKNY